MYKTALYTLQVLYLEDYFASPCVQDIHSPSREVDMHISRHSVLELSVACSSLRHRVK